MPLKEALAQTAADVDEIFDRLLDVDSAPARRVVEAMRYSSLAQGKRLRPFLVLESGRLFDADETGLKRAGAALELVHCYSLVHDDLPAMDDDELRRGKPTCHIAFDEATAILAGDGLLTFAFEVLADADTHEDPQVRSDLVLELAKAAGKAGMVGGQMLDLIAETKTGQSLDEVLAIQNLKTGALFRFAMEAGAILGRAGDDHRAAMRGYADRIGLAFQIADDILDVEGDAATVGKATGKDTAAGKATFVSHLGLDGAKRRARELVQSACEALSEYGDEAETLKEAARFVIARNN